MLSAIEERFFYRLLVQCDDYGRFDARPPVIRARCFPLQLDVVSDGDVAGWLLRLVEVGLVSMYRVDGRSCLQVTTWQRYQQTRAQTSKFPDPPATVPAIASNGYQPPADVPVSGTRSRIRSRTPDIDTRESLLGSPTPTPPPQAGEGADLKPAKQRRRRQNSADEAPSTPLTPATADDVALWERARAELTDGWLPSNVEKAQALEPLGRDEQRALWLRAPPWAKDAVSPHQVRAALVNAGDAAGKHAQIVTGG